jgi:ribosomal protein S15P/S13E
MAKTNYVPSVNILRDAARNISYIPTPNGKRVVGQMVDDFRKGLRAFNLIGSYGTGKSAFLLAFEQSLNGKKPYFTANFLPFPKFGVVKLVGEYKSIIQAFAEKFNLPVGKDTVQDILHEIYNCYYDLGKKNPLLAIEIDEFGKFLEYASQNESEKELYFIQQLAEFAGNPDHNIFLITTIHQSFESYAYGLSALQRQEWTKVKGRFREITFNEPVDQLLYLAAEHIEQSTEIRQTKAILDRSYKIFKETKAFSFSDTYAEEIYHRIYPLDIIAANVLTLSLQRYGQNERSLFSFLESTDHTSLAKFRQSEQPFFNLNSVFDYLNFNFYSFLTSKYNPDFAAWSSIRAALETVERAFDTNINDYQKIIKTIGLLNIYSAQGSAIDRKFMESYAQVCIGIQQPNKLIQQLEEKKIIRYRSYNKRFVLYEGTDLDIQTALIEAANKVSEITDVPTLLKKHFDFTPVLTKAYSFETGTPRYFKYIFSESPINPTFEDEIDGYINLIFSDNPNYEAVQTFSAEVEDAVLYGYYRNAKDIKNLLYEIEKTQRVIDENKEDKIAKKELENILYSQQNLLNHYIINNLYGANGGVVWLWNGQELPVDSKRTFNRHLSQICSQVYAGTPTYKNELVNRPKLSGSIYAAKKNFFSALSSNWNKPELGFDADKFPPEKTIYLTLLRENGLSTYSNTSHELGVSDGSSFLPLWDTSMAFLEQCKEGRRNLEELITTLKTRPFRLKQGLIDFWVPTFLFLRRSDFALFSSDGFIPELNAEILDLLSKSPKDYWIKAFDIEGVKLDIFNSYRIFLNQDVQSKLSNQSFIETIKPFLVFFRQLPEYSRNTKRLSKDALAIKNAIAISRDPEKSFFEDFPSALGTSLTQLKDDKEALSAFTLSLQKAITEIRTSYERLLDGVEEFIQNDIIGDVIPFEEYKEHLRKRFRSLKRHLLLPHQKTFIQRIDSALDDKRAWLNSISQAVVGKALENFKDEDEILLYDKLHNLIFELDSLTKLSKADIDESKEEVLGIQFDSFISGVKQNLVRVPKNKSGKIDKVKADIRRNLSKEKIVDIAALTKLLQELIEQ